MRGLQLWDCSRSQGPICWLRAGGRDTRCAHRGRVEIRRALRAVAMDDAQHRAVVVAQYDRIRSKTANCPTLVSLTLARGEVPAMVALRLFVPESWTSNPARLKRAGVPAEHRAARTKPAIALAEIDRVIAAGVRFGCVLADAGYGLSAPFRQGLTTRGLAWAVGIPRHQKVYPVGVKLIWPVAGRGRPRKRHIPDDGGRRHAGQCQVAKCELAKRDQGSIESPFCRRSGADRRWTTPAYQGQGPAASSRRGGLADRRTQDLRREKILSRQSAGGDRSAHIGCQDQGAMDLRTGASAAERGTRA